MNSFLDRTQDFNPLTWDIQLNPAAWWLSISDVNSAATIELKSSLYSGNLNLTADQYREVQRLVLDKYAGIDYTGMIKGSGMLTDIVMTGKDPGLYMNQERLGYWKDDTSQWQAYIANNGNFAFKWDLNNYITWNGSELVIRGTLMLENGSIAGEWLVTFSQSTTPTALNIWDLWYNTTSTITTRWSGTAWVSMRDVWATKADTALDANSFYQKWLDTNLIPTSKSRTWYTGVILDSDGIGWYTSGSATFRIDRTTGAAFYSWSITAAGLDVWTLWNMRGGQTGYNTGTGFWIWYTGGAHKFSIGNVTNSLTWNWTSLLITGDLTSTATITGWSFRTYNATSQRYSEITPWKIWLQNASGVDIVSIDSSNFRYINADAFIAANTHHSFQTTAEIVSWLWSTIGFDFWSYHDVTKVFSSYWSKLLFNYNTPASIDWLTTNEIRNFTAPNYSTTGPILYFKGYAHIPYIINASFVGRMKIPVWTNLY